MLSSLSKLGLESRAAEAQELVEGNTAFALNLYSQLKSAPGNLFFSPHSISTALAMTYAGARGETEKQVAQVFHFGKDQHKLHSTFGALQRQLVEAAKTNGIELSIANALWGQKDHPFLAEFVAIPRNDYQANLNQADFKAEAEAAREEINRWVAQQTNERIQGILPQGSLNDLTRLVLANAIYFKSAWLKPYEKAETTTQPFHLSQTCNVDAPLMHHFDNVRYTEEADFQAVELPYRGNELSMVVLLPRQMEGCGKLEGRLTPAFLSHTLSQMRQMKVEIFLPRFKLESEFDLSGRLAAMGMPDAFSQKADFSGMDGTRWLYITGVFHKAWGEVNEEGTEAAAATAVAGGRFISRPPPPPPVFRADHPFVFMIRDMRSGSLLFLGRLADPTG